MDNNNQNNDAMVKIGGLWESTTKDGRQKISGSLNAVSQIIILPNKYKETSKHPDYVMYIAARKKPDEKSNNQGGSFPTNDQVQHQEKQYHSEIDNIPF